MLLLSSSMVKQVHENELAKQQQTLETVRFLQQPPDYILLHNRMSLQL